MPEFQKQTVQWFPGHMAKTRREIRENLKLVDAVCEVADSRIPQSSRNPELAEIIGGKPHIILLGKCDLADENATALWCRYFENVGIPTIPANLRTGKGLASFEPVCRKLLADVIERNNRRQMPGKPLRIMVVGIPNTGKSSFINRCAKADKAETADRPGVTKRIRWVRAGKGIELLDTPGVLWPKFEDENVGNKLAFIGSVKDEVTDTETIAVRLIETLKAVKPSSLSVRYGISDEMLSNDAYEVLTEIGNIRGMKMKGGITDTERTADMLLDEFRSGKLGRITLEMPQGF